MYCRGECCGELLFTEAERLLVGTPAFGFKAVKFLELAELSRDRPCEL